MAFQTESYGRFVNQTSKKQSRRSTDTDALLKTNSLFRPTLYHLFFCSAFINSPFVSATTTGTENHPVFSISSPSPKTNTKECKKPNKKIPFAETCEKNNQDLNSLDLDEQQNSKALNSPLNIELDGYTLKSNILGGVLGPIGPSLAFGGAAAGAAGLVVTVLGDGGGSSDAIDSVGGANPPNLGIKEKQPPLTGDPSDPLTYTLNTEYQRNAIAYTLIGLPYAYAYTKNGTGHAGDGIKVAVFDTGTATTHTDLDDNIVDTCVGTCTITDPHGHGTHVAGIVGAELNGKGIHGVAHKAEIVPICANLGGGCQQNLTDNTGGFLLQAANQGARIANMSYGIPFAVTDPGTGEKIGERAMVASDLVNSPVDYTDPALKSIDHLMLGVSGSDSFQAAKQALEQGVIAVVAAGNHTFDWPNDVPETGQAGVSAIAPLIYNNTEIMEDLAKQWIVVVNIDINKSLAPSSHACGDAQDFCLSAPGTGIYSTYLENGYAELTGTSMATPMVSGGIAILMAAFPSLKLPETDPFASMCNLDSNNYNAKQCHSKAIVNRLFITATDLGAVGPDTIYGQGLLNLKAAVQLVGVAQVPTASGERYNLEDSNLNLSPALGTSLASTLASTRFLATDSYDQAGFIYQGTALLGSTKNTKTPIDTSDYLDRSLKPESSTIAINNGQLTLTQQFENTTKPKTERTANYRLNYAIDDQHSIEFTTGFDPLLDFGIPVSPEQGINHLPVSSAFNSPYSYFNEQAQGFKYQLMLPEGYSFETGFFQGSIGQADDNQGKSLDTSSMILQLNSPQLTDAFGSHFKSSFQLGVLEENNSMLGANGSGPWDFSNGSDSLISGFNLDYQLSTNTHLLFSYFYSRTDSDQNKGLLQNNSVLTSNSFNLGLLKHHDENFQYGIFISQPLRLASGQATIQLPTGYSGYELAYSELDIDLSPEGRHLEYELALSWKPEYLDYMRLNLLRIEDYGNIPGNSDSLLLFSAGAKF